MIPVKIAYILLDVPSFISSPSRTTLMSRLAKSTLCRGLFQIGPPIVSWPPQVVQDEGTVILGRPTLVVRLTSS